ncbi:hypothetical protein [Methylobacterium gnaphalii]|uniref:Uncharacterized protein n=1 Tax=Methylobacterium gnaphalii TaxID=1010610 RepID=A0A512JR64_9HYPH|nr:hypothetical protein [Methylobacterium gnaphalii]GEP12455.1 hypothetical protein MGN01_43000 [Methylobacterium gnaphalii]GJD70872.1 hypothetical protein MMMDOFMJ_3825 [Methylobacterium gnaphalii]GLS51547.1 hypothetical protein GCM10007885_44050 [Methylobacterium gnaphalii]
MLMRNPLLSTPPRPPGQPIATCPPVALPIRFDACLRANPVVEQAGPDPVTESLARALGLSVTGVACRCVRLDDGTGLTLVVAEGSAWKREAKARLLTLKRAAAALGRRILLLPDRACDRIGGQATAAALGVGAGLGSRPYVQPQPRTACLPSGRRATAAGYHAGGGRLSAPAPGVAGAAGRASASVSEEGR